MKHEKLLTMRKLKKKVNETLLCNNINPFLSQKTLKRFFSSFLYFFTKREASKESDIY